MVFNRSGNPLKNTIWLQWIAGIGTMVMMLSNGLMMGWTSPYLAKLIADDSPLPITMEEGSWVASLFNCGRFVGAIVGGIGIQYFGSKRMLIVVGLPLMLSWICIIVANSVNWLYIARFSSGMSSGISFSSFPLFLGEVSSPTMRGTMVSLAITGLACGTLVGNIIGVYISMMVFAFVSLVPNVIFMLLFLWIPESPHYLIRLGQLKDAEQSISRYNPTVNSKIELETLKNFISTSESLTLRDQLREFNLPRNRKAGLISLMLYFFMQFSGLNSLVFYAEIVLTAAKVNVIPPATLVMITGGIGVISGWISVYIADKFKRKILMIASCTGVGVSMCSFGTHFALLDSGFNSNALQWLPITSMILFTYSVCIGIITVPNMIVSELFAPNIKNLAACFASISIGLFAFVASKSYQPLVDIIGEAYVFWSHAVLMALAIFFAAIFMPETKGKSLQEIQDVLMR